MKITFWGAAKQVTGSMHLLELNSGYKILLDCGLDYEDRGDIVESNRHFPFFPPQIDCVVLTHAHIDHSGNLPNLINKGYSGPIYCTEPTAELSWNLLQDSFNIQRRSKKKHQRPSYKQKDIAQTFKQFKYLEFGEETEVAPDVKITLQEAGHILGAATCLVEFEENGVKKRLGFTGDLGKKGSPLVPNPVPFENLNYLISESTYGGRLHTSKLESQFELRDKVKEALVNSYSRIIIPAFSVGRTQDILFTLNKLFDSGELERCKVFTDSPLAIKSTAVYESHLSYLNQDAKDYYDQGKELFDFEGLYVLDNRESADLVQSIQEPYIVVSAAGMVEGGRIKEHIRNNIQNPSATILIAGYCSKGTLGARLLSGTTTVRIQGMDRSVHAKIDKTDAFSAHPDHEGLKEFILASTSSTTEKVFLVHGDAGSGLALKQDLPIDCVEVVDRGKVYEF